MALNRTAGLTKDFGDLRAVNEIDLADYRNFADAYAQIGPFIEQVYQHKRIHSALGYLTPAEFEVQWRSQQTMPPYLFLTHHLFNFMGPLHFMGIGFMRLF